MRILAPIESMEQMMVFRPRNVKVTDKRSPMLRLLTEGQADTDAGGTHIYVNYEAQFKTLWKAQRLGYVTDDGDQYITEAGRTFIAKEQVQS